MMPRALDLDAHVQVRPIRPQDKALLAAALLRLSPQSAHARFLTAKPRFNASELRYLTEVDGQDHCALVATPREDPGRIVGVIRYVRLAEDPTTAEMAVVIDDSYQGRGLGRRMGLELAEHARRHGVARFMGLMLSDNLAAHRLFATISAHMSTEHEHAGVDRVLAELAA